MFYDKHGEKQSDYGVYLICDGGYLRWPQLICPYKHEKWVWEKDISHHKLKAF